MNSLYNESVEQTKGIRTHTRKFIVKIKCVIVMLFNFYGKLFLKILMFFFAERNVI